jgi:predicted nucleic acid-binding protein
MILLDAKIFMYAAGAPHPNKVPSRDVLAKIAREELEAAVDAEVLQEILHRYRAIGRWQQGRRVYALARRIVPHVLPIDAEALDGARSILDQVPDVMARDALHASVFRLVRAEAFCSFDCDFDRIPAVTRVEPAALL